MSETDKEVREINERKLKEKGAKIVDQQKQKYNPEQILLQVLEIMRVRSLEMMNIVEEIRNGIINEKQQARNRQNENKV